MSASLGTHVGKAPAPASLEALNVPVLMALSLAL